MLTCFGAGLGLAVMKAGGCSNIDSVNIGIQQGVDAFCRHGTELFGHFGVHISVNVKYHRQLGIISFYKTLRYRPSFGDSSRPNHAPFYLAGHNSNPFLLSILNKP